MKNKLIIVAGCSGSGKSTVAKQIKNSFRKNQAQIICIDRFYKKDATVMPKVRRTGHPNFDHPKAFDWTLLRRSLQALIDNKPTMVPVYDYTKHCRKAKRQLIKPTKIIIFEGFLSLFDERFSDMAELKIYVDTDIEECFKRRLERDQKHRGRTAASVKMQWNETVVPMYEKYVKPRRWKADIVLPWDRTNLKSIKYLITAIKTRLGSR